MDDLPSTFLILSASFSSTNRCFSSGISFLFTWGFIFVLLCSFTERKTGSVFPAFCHATFHHALITCCGVSRAEYNIAQMYHQWRIQGRGPSWGPKGRKKRPGAPLSQGLGDRAPPYLKVWIHHWSWLLYSDTFTFDFSQGQYVTKNQPMADPCLVEWKSWNI